MLRFRYGGRVARTAAVVVALLTAIIAIGLLSYDVLRKIEQQSTASTDNVQWTVAQINVEYLQLLVTLEAANSGREQLSAVRQRFDVFYSRMVTMRASSVFEVLRQDATFSASFNAVWGFLQRKTAVIDGPDDQLQAALPSLTADVRALRQDASVMGLSGIRVFARRTDIEREGFKQTLLQVSVLTIGLIVIMGVLAATLAKLNTTIRRQSLRNLEQSERVKAVFATSLDAVIVVDASGHVLEYNAAAETMFGYSAKEVIGQPMAPFIIPPAMRAAHDRGMERLRQQPSYRVVVGAGRLRLEAMRKGGETFPIELAVSVSDGAEGKIFISYLRDVSAQVAAEKELLRARDDALAGEKAKAELLAVMSHEMRTPLNGMLGTMELLKETRLTEKQKQYHRIMESSGRLLLHHVNDVLDISRVDSGKAVISQRSVDLATLIDDIVESQQPVARSGVNVLRATLPEDGLTVIKTDPLRLRQILLNLVGNALKFTRNGEVSIEVERMDDAKLIEFRVADTGIGIKEEDRERIFDDFVTLDASYSRSASGTGLGLGIVRRWVHAMGGEVGVESEPGEGSLFWVRLPLVEPAERPAAHEPAKPETTTMQDFPTTKLSILVVEDNAINRLVVREMLESDGHSVVEAHDGDEGVKIAAARKWDVIFMDVSMPGRDGVTATRDIRKSNGASAETPIIALTAHALPSETQRFHEAGMQLVMTKPVSRGALRKALRQMAEPKVDRPIKQEPLRDPHERRATPLVDMTVLSELRETLGAAGVNKLIRAFLTETDPLIDRWRTLSRAVLDQSPNKTDVDLAALQAEVHRTSGSAAMIGAARLRAGFARTETACQLGREHDAMAALNEATQCWAETRETLLTAAPEPLAS